MSVAQETIEDIIREKRGIAAKIRANLSIVPVRREDQLLVADSLDQEADRLEAALKRENELSKLRPKNAANLGQFGDNPDTLGNVSAIRDAIVKIYHEIRSYCYDYGAGESHKSLVDRVVDDPPDYTCYRDSILEIDRIVEAALSAPARNCDIQFKDNVARYNAFKDWCKTKGNAMSPELAYDAFEWLLFSPANERGAE